MKSLFSMSNCNTFTLAAQLYVIDLGGWLMRKSWKIYEKVYKDIAQLYDDSKRNGKVNVQVDETNVIDQEEGDAGRCYCYVTCRTKAGLCICARSDNFFSPCIKLSEQ